MNSSSYKRRLDARNLARRDRTRVRRNGQPIRQAALDHAIFSSVNFASIATDRDGVIHIFNVGAERMLGYSAIEIVATISQVEISDPHERVVRAATLSQEWGLRVAPGFEALVFNASRGLEDVFELTYIRKDGSRWPTVVAVTALRGANDAIVGYLFIGTDNAARKQAEAALQNASALHNAIFNSANFSSIATNAQGVIQIFNVGAEAMLGYAAAEVVNLFTTADLAAPEDLVARAAALTKEYDQLVRPGFEALVFKAARGIEDVYELTCIRKDQSRLCVLASVTALRDPAGTIIGYLLIGIDNTVRNRVEAAKARVDVELRNQQFYMRSLIEANIDALMVTDSRGIISDVNQQMMVLTGRKRSELVGEPCHSFFTEPGRADAAIALVLADGRVRDYELTVLGSSGHQTVVSYNAATFHTRDGKVKGVIAAARDVTERRRLERVKEQTRAELERASRMKSEFLATMSHELRTPLNAIIGFSEALKDGLIGPLSQPQQGYVGDIFDSGMHLLALINDILDLSKVEAGMMTLEAEPVNLEALLRDSLTIVKEAAADQQIELALDVDIGPEMIQLDRRKLRQMMYNLLSNAVKFSAFGSRVVLRARQVTRASVGKLPGRWPSHGFPLAPGGHDRFIELRVCDHGIGIAATDMERLFKPFSQIDSRLARQFTGTGLGLAMVKQLAELHGGSVAVASAVGEGSCFAFWFPMEGPESSLSSPAGAPASSRMQNTAA